MDGSRESFVTALDCSHVPLPLRIRGFQSCRQSTIAASVVTLHHQKAFASQGLRPQICRHAPVVGDELHMWTSIARDHCRVGSRSKLRRVWLVDSTLQGNLPIRGGNRKKLRWLHVQGRDKRVFILVLSWKSHPSPLTIIIKSEDRPMSQTM